MSLSLSASPSNTRVELQVGERRFTTLATTLSAGSTFFASLLSERWEDSRSADGSFFIDADPDLFAHILRYLRRGVLPVVFDKIRGFDHAFYQELEAEAVYFGIEPLHEWIKDEGYLLAVTIQYSMEEVKSQGSVVSNDKVTVSGNTERSYYPTWETERVYQCPRGIFVHHGNPSSCGRTCARAKGDNENQFVERGLLRTLVVTKRIVFHRVDTAFEATATEGQL